MSGTPFINRCDILGAFWMEYKNDEAQLGDDGEGADSNLAEFISYNDLGLPLAYAIGNGIVSKSEIAEKLINETWKNLLNKLHLKDTGFEVLDDIYEALER